MRDGKTAHDIKEGTLFRFHPGQCLELHVDNEKQFRYLHQGARWAARVGAYDDKIIAYMGLKRIEEVLLPVKRKKRRRNFHVLRPAFLMDGKLIFVDSFDMLYPFEGQDDIYKEEE